MATRLLQICSDRVKRGAGFSDAGASENVMRIRKYILFPAIGIFFLLGVGANLFERLPREPPDFVPRDARDFSVPTEYRWGFMWGHVACGCFGVALVLPLCAFRIWKALATGVGRVSIDDEFYPNAKGALPRPAYGSV